MQARNLLAAIAFATCAAVPARGVCPGDCRGDGAVAVDELVSLVNIALGALPETSCEAGDRDGDGAVDVTELVRAVQAALEGCPPPASILSAFFGLDDALPSIVERICPGGAGTDGMPVVFSDEINQDTLDADDFVVITAGGVEKVPRCVTHLPAGEENEDRTVLLIGDLGDAVEDPPASVVVSGRLFGETAGNLQGLETDRVTPLAAGPFLVHAEVVEAGEQELGRPGNGGGCPLEGTLQVVKVTWAGGVVATSGEELGDAERMRYRVTFEDGSQIVPFALADLNDNDNNHDLCLDDARRPVRIGMGEDTVIDPNGDPNPHMFVLLPPQ